MAIKPKHVGAVLMSMLILFKATLVHQLVNKKNSDNIKMHGKIKKVKCTLVQALRLCTGRTAHRGSRNIVLLFRAHGTRRGEGSASRPGRSLSPGKTRYALYRRLGGPQGRSG
jgi:hypothetical protein